MKRFPDTGTYDFNFPLVASSEAAGSVAGRTCTSQRRRITPWPDHSSGAYPVDYLIGRGMPDEFISLLIDQHGHGAPHSYDTPLAELEAIRRIYQRCNFVPSAMQFDMLEMLRTLGPQLVPVAAHARDVFGLTLDRLLARMDIIFFGIF